MGKHSKTGARSMSVRTYLAAGITAGVTSAAMAGIGLLAILQDQTPTTAHYEIRLSSTGEDCGPAAAADCYADRKDVPSGLDVEPDGSADAPYHRTMLGPNGWLI